MTLKRSAQQRLSVALEQLAATKSDLAAMLADLTAVVVEEADRNTEFAARLRQVIIPAGPPPASTATAESAAPKTRPKRGRRAPGPWDPFAVYADVGEAGLRDRLRELELEQLRDIIAEHGMNNDGKALKWKTIDNVIGRIVDRVVDRSAKGDVFRQV